MNNNIHYITLEDTNKDDNIYIKNVIIADLVYGISRIAIFKGIHEEMKNNNEIYNELATGDTLDILYSIDNYYTIRIRSTNMRPNEILLPLKKDLVMLRMKREYIV